MKQLTTLIILLTIIFIGCNSTDQNVTEESISAANTDTTVTLIINGASMTFVVPKQNHLNLEKFQSFLDKYPTVPLIYIDTIIVDINGGNIDDKIISKIVTKNGDCTLFSTIIIDNQIISTDTLTPNNDLAFMDWSNDSIYFKLKPYSSFFDALFDKNVVEELENGKLDEGIIEFYINSVSLQLKDKAYDSTIVNFKTDSIINEIRNYKGKIITSLEHWDRSLLIWNSKTKNLEVIYSP